VRTSHRVSLNPAASEQPRVYYIENVKFSQSQQDKFCYFRPQFICRTSHCVSSANSGICVARTNMSTPQMVSS